MIGHNIRFKGVIWKIIPKLFLLLLLSGALWNCTGCGLLSCILTSEGRALACKVESCGTQFNQISTSSSEYISVSPYRLLRMTELLFEELFIRESDRIDVHSLKHGLLSRKVSQYKDACIFPRDNF